MSKLRLGSGTKNILHANEPLLWEETPQRHDAAKSYGIAHPDDISDLIIHWARALVVDEPFDATDHCQRYHEHWARFGKTAPEGGGWK